MKIALSARIKLDPKRILNDRWAHDQAHNLARAKRRALSRRKNRRK